VVPQFDCPIYTAALTLRHLTRCLTHVIMCCVEIYCYMHQ